MLFCNGERIDLQKKEGIHAWVKTRIDKLIQEYKLNRGGNASIDYVKTLISIDPVTKKKKKPASIGIDFYEKVFNEDKDFQEMQEWRYCDSMTEHKGRKNSYYPSGLTLTGSRNLGFKDVELIFFLKYISSRVENGFNNAGKNKKYIRFEDKLKDAQQWREEEQTKAYIKNSLISTEINGGLKDEHIRNIAAALVLPQARNENYPVDMIRRDLVLMTEKDKAMLDTIAGLINTVNGEGVKVMGDIAEAKDLKLIDIKKISNAPHWVFLNKDGSTAAKIVKIPAGSMNEAEKFLKEFYLNNPDDLKYFIDSLVELKGIKN